MRNNPAHPCPTNPCPPVPQRDPRVAPGPCHGRACRRAGFTLMELLMVVLIIGVLISIIVPTVARVREQAHAVSTQALIGNLEALIRTYQGDFNAYPGPLSNMQVYANADAPGGTDPGAATVGLTEAPGSVALDETRITGNENLVLGLFGGLRRVGDEIHFNTDWVGKGPGWLGGTPRKIPAYAEASDLSTGDYVDANGESGFDSAVPELVDRFPEPMPLLFLRSRPGNRTTGNSADDNPIVTLGGDRPGQYDLSQILGYTQGDRTQAIGVGRKLPKSEYDNTPLFAHGLQTVVPGTMTAAGSANFSYPYNAYAAFRNHAASGAFGGNDETPKQKDGYMIISAGIDRVYGTNDDITNFGKY